MTNFDLIPCEICLKVAVCRHLQYEEMLKKCPDVGFMLYAKGQPDYPDRKPHFEVLVEEVEKVQNPVKWHLINLQDDQITRVITRRKDETL